MEVKTSELTGAALDWAVAKCELLLDKWGVCSPVGYKPSYNWAQGGPIIDREGIGFFQKKGEGYCQAAKPGAEFVQRGPTPLVAVMRCYVASKLGDTVDIPYDLL